MRDPYEVLGITRDAFEDEIKKAYRQLARKYHPDNYAGSAMAESAEEKMKEINEAYEEIQKIRSGKTYDKGFGFGGYQSEYDNYSDYGFAGAQGSGSLGEVRRLITEGRYSEAELIIDSVPNAERGAEWNYLKGCILVRRGMYYDALKYIEIARYLDPENIEYAEAIERLRDRSSSFGSDYRTTQLVDECDFCDCCSTLICADGCCECLGGDLIWCC